MSCIRSKNTQAELIVFRYLKKKRIYFQKHYKRVDGCPDIALPRKKKAVFIHGDFWHGRNQERMPKTNKAYWLPKIAGNIARDARNQRNLKEKGWGVLVVWEKKIMQKKSQAEQLIKIELFLRN